MQQNLALLQNQQYRDMKMRKEANGAGLRTDVSVNSGNSRWTTKKSTYVSSMKYVVRSKLNEKETSGVQDFREARSKYLERKREED